MHKQEEENNIKNIHGEVFCVVYKLIVAILRHLHFTSSDNTLAFASLGNVSFFHFCVQFCFCLQCCRCAAERVHIINLLCNDFQCAVIASELSLPLLCLFSLLFTPFSSIYILSFFAIILFVSFSLTHSHE